MSMKVGNGLDLQNQRIQNVGDPTSNSDAANKQYVDAFVRGLSWKDEVVAASTGDVSLTSAPATLDGVTLADGDRILLKDQADPAENGVYGFTAESAALTRTVDADTAAKLAGATLTVVKGSTNADRVYRLVTDDIDLGTTSLSFTQLGGASAAYVAGDGLSESPANQFNVSTGAGLEISGDAVRIATGAAGDGLTGGGGSPLAVNPGTGLEIDSDTVRIAEAAAGDGLTGGGAVALAVDTATVSRRVAANVGDGSATSIAVTHNLNTRDVSVEVYRNSSPYDSIICDVERNSTTQVTLKFATAPTSAEYRVVVS